MDMTKGPSDDGPLLVAEDEGFDEIRVLFPLCHCEPARTLAWQSVYPLLAEDEGFDEIKERPGPYPAGNTPPACCI